MTSFAVGLDRVSRVVGYLLKKGNFQTISQNLPQRIVIFGEANTANQSSLSLLPQEITSAKQAGELYGYGSPIHYMMRILRPRTSDGVGGIPTIVIPQAEVVGATAKLISVTVTGGAAQRSGTHTLKIAGRDNVDAQYYAININSGDSINTICGKIADVVNNVLGSPMSASNFGYSAFFTSKWKGLTSNDLNISVDTGEDTLGLTYVVSSPQNGSGTPDLGVALASIGNVWYTWLLNSYGTVNSIMNSIQEFNGRPDDIPTGRFVGTVWKPLIAVTGSIAEDPSALTDTRKDEVTIAIAPAPLSKGLPMEAAANAILLAAVKAQNTPELDIAGDSYPDMPTPTSIGSMADYNNRDIIVKKGCSTVSLVSGRYQIEDFVTTYHKAGEEPPQFRFVRNLVVDMNVRYTYLIKEQTFVIGKVLANDDDEVESENVIKPKTWKSILSDMSEDLVKRALTVDADFTQASLVVSIGTGNPDRFETEFKYKRSGIGRVLSTTATAGFNFGTGV